MITEQDKEQLLEAASLVRNNSYSPYSKYKVGAALLTNDEKIITGTNVENSSFGLTICAERAALFNAISAGYQDIQALAVITCDGNAPCGACRQVLSEFNPEMIILVGDSSGKLIKEYRLSALLPYRSYVNSIQNSCKKNNL